MPAFVWTDPPPTLRREVPAVSAAAPPLAAVVKPPKVARGLRQCFTDGGRAQAGFVERNDCTVRAIAIACRIDYASAHAACKAAGRKDGRGAMPSEWGSVLRAQGWTYRHGGRCTVACFVRNHPRGRFVCAMRGHAFAVIDGVVHDNGALVGARCRVQFYFTAPVDQ